MATRPDATAGADGESWVPDVCTLPTAEQPLHVAAFDDLFAASLRHVERGQGPGARLVLAGDASLPARVRDLVDAETSCCSFFTFALSPLPDEPPGATVLALDVRVPPAHRAVLEGLLTRL